MTTPRYGNGGAKGTRQFDDTPLSDGFVDKGLVSWSKGRRKGPTLKAVSRLGRGSGAVTTKPRTAVGYGKSVDFGKTRHYDPEHRRQQRLGAATALLATGGGVAGYKGVRGAMKTSATVHNAGQLVSDTKRAVALRNTLKHVASARPRDLALLSGGAAGVGGAGAIQGHANSRRGKGWD